MKLFFKKLWIWVKTYWYILVIIILAILAFILGQSRDLSKIFKLISQEREIGKKEIQIIEEAHVKKDKAIENNIDKYIEDRNKLEKEHDEKIDQINKENLEKAKDLSNNIKESPSKVLSRIAKEMGWDYER